MGGPDDIARILRRNVPRCHWNLGGSTVLRLFFSLSPYSRVSTCYSADAAVVRLLFGTWIRSGNEICQIICKAKFSGVVEPIACYFLVRAHSELFNCDESLLEFRTPHSHRYFWIGRHCVVLRLRQIILDTMKINSRRNPSFGYAVWKYKNTFTKCSFAGARRRKNDWWRRDGVGW